MEFGDMLPPKVPVSYRRQSWEADNQKRDFKKLQGWQDKHWSPSVTEEGDQINSLAPL